jgi:mannose-6-phosphate isomerase-like protein (cupin superfamily)
MSASRPDWAAAHLDDLGHGPGFRKVRRALDVTAFGVNAIVMPEGSESPHVHYHERQQELYFVHRGELEFELGDGHVERLRAGSFLRVDPAVPRRMRNVGRGDAVYVAIGGEGGYVGHDGVEVTRPRGA